MRNRNRVTCPAIMFLLPRFAPGPFLLLQLRFTFFEGKPAVPRNRVTLCARTAFPASLILYLLSHFTIIFALTHAGHQSRAQFIYVHYLLCMLFSIFFSFDKTCCILFYFFEQISKIRADNCVTLCRIGAYLPNCITYKQQLKSNVRRYYRFHSLT